MNYIQGINRYQESLIPLCPEDYIDAENPVRVIDAFVDTLNMEELEFIHARLASTGRSPYNPKDLLKLYFYGYMNRIRSSRRLEKETYRNLEVIWLIKGLKPDFKTIADFRKNNTVAIKRVFKKFVMICKDWDLFSQELIAVDGSKFKAWNGKKKNFNKKKLKQKLEYLDEKITEYLQLLDDNDREKPERDLTKEEINNRIQELKERKEIYEDYKELLEEGEVTQISLTDSEARSMKNNQKVEVCYNVQSVIEEKNKLMIDFEVTNKVKDLGMLGTMSKRAKEILGVDTLEVLADKGYYKSIDLKECVDNGIIPYIPKPADSNAKTHKSFPASMFTYDRERDLYVCPAGEELTFKTLYTKKDKEIKRYYNYDVCRECEIRDQCTKAEKNGRLIDHWLHKDLADEIEERTKANLDKYRKRQMLVEHPFGTVKRGMDAYYVLTKGMKSVGAEIGLLFCVYNMKRVMNLLGVEEMVRRLQGV